MKFVVCPDKGIPKGLTCELCHRTAKEGEVIGVKSFINVGHYVWHRRCLQLEMDEGPQDEETISEAYERIQKEGIFS